MDDQSVTATVLSDVQYVVQDHYDVLPGRHRSLWESGLDCDPSHRVIKILFSFRYATQFSFPGRAKTGEMRSWHCPVLC